MEWKNRVIALLRTLDNELTHSREIYPGTDLHDAIRDLLAKLEEGDTP